MRNILITVLATLLITLGTNSVYAAVGDTTWITVTADQQITDYGIVDFDITLPDNSKTYRQIFFIFELGIHNCPSGTEYCHQWDYDVENYIMTETDTLELGRFITPFATSGFSRFPNSWKKPYIFDITHLEPFLHGDVGYRFHYTGWSFGFKATVKFAFIEGTPDRTVLGIDKLDQGYYEYGNNANKINDRLPVHHLGTPEGTFSTEMNVLISGHGSDNQGCCEFLDKSYKILLNDAEVANQLVWKDDCGLNNLYPQGGTWIFDRANWCPGERVPVITHKLTQLNSGNEGYDLQMQFENYTGSGELGAYRISSYVVYYGSYNKTLDASIEAIHAPTNDDNYFRENPATDIPEITVKNRGGSTITSMEIEYGVKDSTVYTYLWEGSLAPLEEIRIVLEQVTTLRKMSMLGETGVHTFNVSIIKVNETEDDDLTNNSISSQFVVADVFPNTFVVEFKPSNLNQYGNVNSTNSDASWTIENMEGEVLYSRLENTPLETYIDTVNFTQTGYYKLTITTKACGGLSWWLFKQVLPGYKAGSFKLKRANGTALQMKGYKYSGNGSHDFGCEFVYYFTIKGDDYGLGMEDFDGFKGIEIYPNPASEKITLTNLPENSNLSIIDAFGKVVFQKSVDNSIYTVDVNNYTNGIYFAQIEVEGLRAVKKFIVNK